MNEGFWDLEPQERGAEDGEQCIDCLRYGYDPHQDTCLLCGHGQLRPGSDDHDDDYLADFIPEDWSGEAMT